MGITSGRLADEAVEVTWVPARPRIPAVRRKVKLAYLRRFMSVLSSWAKAQAPIRHFYMISVSTPPRRKAQAVAGLT
jgi:hypothetical protein